MAEKETKITQTSSAAVGNQAVPTTLGNTTKLDIDTNKVLVDNIIDYGLTGGLNSGELEKFTSISNSRDQIYQVIDTMAQDSAVSAIIKTYADSACETADNGHIVWCESSNPKISKFINYLLNVMNIDKNIYGWTYCLVKYGDTYLRLYRDSDYEDKFFNKANVDKAFSARNVLTEEAKKKMQENVTLNVHRASDPYSYYVEMVADPGTMFELTKCGTTYGYIETPNTESAFDVAAISSGVNNTVYANYKMKSNDVNVYQADDFVHACLDDNYDRYPEHVDLFTTNKDYKSGKNGSSYSVRRGKSMLIDNYKVWREKALLENAILLNRVTKSSIVRKIGVEVGDMPKEQVAVVLRRVKDLFEQKTVLNNGVSLSDSNNPGPIENNVYFATHNGQGAITVEAVGGDVDVKGLADLDSWVNKFYSGFGVPKAYYGWTEDGAGFNGGTSLSIISSQFAKGIKHIQNAMIQAITDAINLILVNKGLKAYLNNFVLKMKAPLTKEEADYREDFNNRVQAISSLQALFTDVEDKARRLTIIKNLVATLNYGDEIGAQLDEEIKALKEKAAKEAEQAAKEAEEQAALEANEMTELSEETPAEEPDTESSEEDLDLGLSSVAPVESFKPEADTQIINEDIDKIVTDDDDLPTAEELGEDLTKNK